MGCSPFIWASPVPLASTNVSFAVCQCQGTAQPAVNFSKSADGPLDGSPCSTETVMHVGSPGRFANLLFAGDTTPIAPAFCAADIDVSPRSRNNPLRIRLFKSHPRIGIDNPRKHTPK